MGVTDLSSSPVTEIVGVCAKAEDVERWPQCSDGCGTPAVSECSTTQATFIAVGILLNPAMYSVPFMFKLGGVLCFASIVAACLFGVFSTWLLLSALHATKASDGEVGWQEVAASVCNAAGGKLMRALALAETFMYLTNSCGVMVTACSAFAPEWGTWPLVCLHCAAAVLLSYVPDRMYSYVSLFSSVSLLGSCACILGSGVALGEGAARALQPLGQGVDQLPTVFTYCVFNIGCHCCYPMIYKIVGHQVKPAMVAISSGTVLFGIVASVFGSVGYALFGNDTQPVCLHNVGVDMALEPHPLAAYFVVPLNVFMVLKFQLGTPLLARPLGDMVCHVVGWPQRCSNGGRSALLAAVPVYLLVLLVSGLVTKYLKLYFLFQGAVLVPINMVLAPCLFFLKKCEPGIKMRLLLLAYSCLGLALPALVIAFPIK